jgi:DNA-directed RNA polymerase subunit K/omega
MSVQMKAPQSQFAYVVLAARRVRQIMVDNQRTQKATRIACEEVNHGLIEYDYTEPGEKEAEKDGKRKK